MSQDTWPNGSYADFADLARRRDALRHAAAMPGADPRALLEATFAELDTAVDAVTKLVASDTGDPGGPPASLSAERGLLRAVFQNAPAPLFLRPESTRSAIQIMTRRMDMVTAVTRLLLDNSTFSEAVTLQRCARLLAGDIASWVIVDVERADRLRRQFVIGPHDEAQENLARKARAVDPQAGTAPAQVHSAGRSMVLAHPDDPGILGTAPDGTPLLMLLGVTSLLSVPISDGTTGYGVLTLGRQATEGRFEIAELGLAEELGEHLGVAIRVDRMFRHRSAVAEALQGSLLPARLPDIEGLDLSAAYVPASEGMEASGDFYDVFPVQGGWAITVGDVCGKGLQAAAMTAAARHAIRVIAHWSPDPVETLAKVNEVILAGDYEDRFVTAELAYLRWDGGQVHVVLASAGHPVRFAVHRRGYPVASPRSHGVPRRDVDGRVHVRVTGETAGSAPEHGLRFQTYRAWPQWSRSTACWAGGWGGAGTGRCEHTIGYRRHFRGGEAAFPPRPEGRGLLAAILMTQAGRAPAAPLASLP